jgi:hypothetical protein
MPLGAVRFVLFYCPFASRQSLPRMTSKRLRENNTKTRRSAGSNQTVLSRTKSGISKVYFIELPKEVQARFNYDPQKGAEFTSLRIDEIRLTQQQKSKQTKNEPTK